MSRGKEICNELKAVRRRIAEENGIVLEIPECTHKGPCPGTCPRCEQELRQLESALADRLRLGKVATVAGIALALATPAVAQVHQTHNIEPQGIVISHVSERHHLVRGVVVDEKTKEPLPFANVVAIFAKRTVCTATTDFDGVFTMELPAGKYTLKASFVGYEPVVKTVKVAGKEEELHIEMKMQPAITGLAPVEIVGMTDYRVPTFEMGDGTMSNERDGVTVRVQY